MAIDSLKLNSVTVLTFAVLTKATFGIGFV